MNGSASGAASCHSRLLTACRPRFMLPIPNPSANGLPIRSERLISGTIRPEFCAPVCGKARPHPSTISVSAGKAHMPEALNGRLRRFRVDLAELQGVRVPLQRTVGASAVIDPHLFLPCDPAAERRRNDWAAVPMRSP